MILKRRQFLACSGAALAVPARAHDKSFTVVIRSFSFEVPESELHPTDKVTFVNHDIAAHTASAIDGSWDTGILEKGESITLTIAQGWIGDFYCVFHPNMTGTLLIGSL
ncbi:hypothetical protein ROA7450_02445 [Roseovarius albus]|uniref:Amicyanin n=1 Tax=Roseovarius albus TaxID=1247867 RepID=A0A1X6ZFG7_9RHOB|nr:hypothetical protein [Roseovarius albus]SLN49474.1 hypothetical protein ROA7450_02445 [Roseovarius albus]